MSTGARRLLCVCSTLSHGGAERFASTVLGLLDRSEFEPHLCLFRNEVMYPLPDDVPLIILDKKRPWHLPSAVNKLTRLIDHLEPDVVLSLFAHPNLITGEALRRSRHRPRWVARVSNNPPADQGWLARRRMRHLYQRADALLSNSSALADAIAIEFPVTAGRIHFVPNPTDFSTIDRLAGLETTTTRRSRFALISVARLARQKRLDRLIDLVAALGDRLDLELVICGDGSLGDRLKRRAARTGARDRVRFEGFCANPYARMARSDLFVLSSQAEGSPNALIEAQGLGIPAVSTDCRYGPEEIIEPEVTGVLVPVGDALAMEQQVERLLLDPELRLRMGTRASERARRLFGAESIMPGLARILAG